MTDPGTPATDAVSLVNAMTGFVAESGRYNRPIPPSHHTPNLHPADPLMMAANQYPAPFAPLGHLPLSFHPAASNFHPHAYANPHAVHPAAYHQMQTYGQYIPPFAYPPAAVWPDHHRQGYPPYMNSAPPQMPPPGFPPGGIPYGAPPHFVPHHQQHQQQHLPAGPPAFAPGGIPNGASPHVVPHQQQHQQQHLPAGPPAFAPGHGPQALGHPREAVAAYAALDAAQQPPTVINGILYYPAAVPLQTPVDPVENLQQNCDEQNLRMHETTECSSEDRSPFDQSDLSSTDYEPRSDLSDRVIDEDSSGGENSEIDEEYEADELQESAGISLAEQLKDTPEPVKGGGMCASRFKRSQVEMSGAEKLASAPTASRTITRSQATVMKSSIVARGTDEKGPKVAKPVKEVKCGVAVKKKAPTKEVKPAAAKLALEKVAAVNAASVKDGDGGVASQLPEKRGPGRRPKVNQRSRPRTANNQRITSNAEFTARKAAEAAAEAAKEKKADNKDKTDYDCSSASRSTGLYDKKESKKVDEVVQKVGDKLAKTNKK